MSSSNVNILKNINYIARDLGWKETPDAIGFNIDESEVSHSFHVGDAASIGWLHLHSYMTKLRTSAYDTMEMMTNYRKNTPFDEIMDGLTQEDEVLLERTMSVWKDVSQ